MIPVYVPVSDRRRITIPLVAFEQLDMGTSRWLRLSIVEPGRALLERVPPDVPEALIVRAAAAFGMETGARTTSSRGGQ